jgi:hypothetical protein
MKIIEKEFNVITGEETIVEREETPKEAKEREYYNSLLIAEQAEAQTKAAARQAILNRLGLTAEEAAILLG